MLIGEVRDEESATVGVGGAGRDPRRGDSRGGRAVVAPHHVLLRPAGRPDRRELTESVAALRRARSAELEARLEGARAAERARIAREIHDSVGHHSTLIAVQSAALAATAPDEVVREAALGLRGLAKESLAEMRAALGLLNDGPPLGLADLPSLLTRVCRAGLRIEFDGDVLEHDTSPAVG